MHAETLRKSLEGDQLAGPLTPGQQADFCRSVQTYAGWMAESRAKLSRGARLALWILAGVSLGVSAASLLVAPWLSGVLVPVALGCALAARWGRPRRAPLWEVEDDGRVQYGYGGRDGCMVHALPFRSLVIGAEDSIWLVASPRKLSPDEALAAAPDIAEEVTVAVLADGSTWWGQVSDGYAGPGSWTVEDLTRGGTWPAAALWLAGPGALSVGSEELAARRREPFEVDGLGKITGAVVARVILPEDVLIDGPPEAARRVGTSDNADAAELGDFVQFLVGSGSRLWAVAGTDPRLSPVQVATLPHALGLADLTATGASSAYVWGPSGAVRAAGVTTSTSGAYMVEPLNCQNLAPPIAPADWADVADAGGEASGWRVATEGELVKRSGGKSALASYRFVEVRVS